MHDLHLRVRKLPIGGLPLPKSFAAQLFEIAFVSTVTGIQRDPGQCENVAGKSGSSSHSASMCPFRIRWRASQSGRGK